MLIDTPLLVLGRGPAALVVAKVAAGCGLACLLAGHEAIDDDVAVPLTPEAAEALVRHGVLDVLRPYLDRADPPTISPRTFEEVLKHHCVADVNVTVYDQVTVVEREFVGRGLRGVLTDGKARWDLAADVVVDTATLPTSLSAAITAGVAAALDAVGAPHPSRAAGPG
jgi:hypothetical protein